MLFFLVPKQHAQNPGSGELFSFYMDTTNVRKYLYIKDTKITGNDLNASSSDTLVQAVKCLR